MPKLKRKQDYTSKVDRQDFLARLSGVRPGLAPKEMVEQTTYFVFKGGRVITYNSELACSQKSGVEIQGAVLADPLFNLLSRMKEEKIGLECNGKELVVVGRNKRSGIRMQKEITLPLDSIEKPGTWLPLAEGFSDACSMAASCTSHDARAPVITCVHIGPKFVEATDNYQVLRQQIETGLKEDVFVRHDLLKHVCDMKPVECSLADSWVHFRNKDRLVVSCRQTKLKYPDLNRLLEVNGEEAEIPKELGDAAEMISRVFTDGSDRVLIDMREDKLLVEARGETAWHQETMSVKYKGQPLKFVMSSSLLSEVSKRYNKCEITESRLKVDGENYRYVTCLGAVEPEKVESAK